MASLSEMRTRHEGMSWDDPGRIPLEEEINKREQWCIDNKPEYNVKFTNFAKTLGGGNSSYPFHTGYVNIRDIGMLGIFNGKGIDYNTDGSVHCCERDIKL